MRNPSSTSKTTTPCCSKVGIKRGPWTAVEDEILANFVKKEGEGRWRTLPKRAGLQRCGKSCRLRWMNYLRPSVKRGHIAPDEEDLILRLHRLLGNRWSLIAGRIPGRTDNEIKNYWNTHLSKKLISQGIDPRTHKPLETHEHKHNDPNSENTTFLGPRSIPEIGSCSSSQKNQTKATENNWDGCGKVVGLEVEDGGENNKEMIIGEDDTLSSFLDSLINDNEGQGSQRQELQLQANHHLFPVPTPLPLTSSMQSFDLSFWEAELRTVVGDEHYGSLFK